MNKNLPLFVIILCALLEVKTGLLASQKGDSSREGALPFARQVYPLSKLYEEVRQCEYITSHYENEAHLAALSHDDRKLLEGVKSDLRMGNQALRGAKGIYRSIAGIENIGGRPSQAAILTMCNLYLGQIPPSRVFYGNNMAQHVNNVKRSTQNFVDVFSQDEASIDLKEVASRLAAFKDNFNTQTGMPQETQQSPRSLHSMQQETRLADLIPNNVNLNSQETPLNIEMNSLPHSSSNSVTSSLSSGHNSSGYKDSSSGKK